MMLSSLSIVAALAGVATAAGNGALIANPSYVNGAPAQINITTRGSDWYFTVCACMTVSTFVFLGLAITKPRQHRIFHYITAGITMVASIAYFTMGSNLGFTPIAVEFVRGNEAQTGINRSIFYVRYIDWVITTPLLLMDLLLTAGMPWPTVLFAILVDEVMIITGLVGALVASSYKWGYYVFGNMALFYILYLLVWEARIHAKALGSDVSKVFLMCGSLTSVLWTLYPIAWGLSEGGNVITSDSEAIFYGVLDLFAKPVFGALLIFGHKNIDPARLGLYIHDYTEKDHFVNEKQAKNGNTTTSTHTNGHHTNGTNGVTNGATNGTTAETV